MTVNGDGLWRATWDRYTVWLSGRDGKWSADIGLARAEYVASTVDQPDAKTAVRWAEDWLRTTTGREARLDLVKLTRR